MYKFAFAFIVFIIFIFKLTSSPGQIVVNQEGEIQGLFNMLRESVQGKRFWRDQAKEISKKLEWEVTEPERQAEWDRKTEELERELDRELEELYRDSPNLKPSRAELLAERLREEADRIEQAELDRELEQLRLEGIEDLRVLLEVVKAKL
jgi:hypothetical protein